MGLLDCLLWAVLRAPSNGDCLKSDDSRLQWSHVQLRLGFVLRLQPDLNCVLVKRARGFFADVTPGFSLSSEERGNSYRRVTTSIMIARNSRTGSGRWYWFCKYLPQFKMCCVVKQLGVPEICRYTFTSHRLQSGLILPYYLWRGSVTHPFTERLGRTLRLVKLPSVRFIFEQLKFSIAKSVKACGEISVIPARKITSRTFSSPPCISNDSPA